MSKSKKFVLTLSVGLLAGLGMTPAFSQIGKQETVIQTPQPVAPAVVGLHQFEDPAVTARPAEKAGKVATKSGAKGGAGKAKASKGKTSKAKAVSGKQAAKGKNAVSSSGKSKLKKSQQAAAKRKKAN